VNVNQYGVNKKLDSHQKQGVGVIESS